MFNFSRSRNSNNKSYIYSYKNVIYELELIFNRYESGKISISSYIYQLNEMEKVFKRERSICFRILDISGVLRDLNRAEREAFNNATALLAWCRDWAMRQQEIEMSSCLVSAGESLRQDPNNETILPA